MDAQNKSRRSTDAHKHGANLWRLGAEVLSVVLGEGAWQGGPLSLLRVRAASVTAHCETNTEHYFHVLPFFVKSKILFGFL